MDWFLRKFLKALLRSYIIASTYNVLAKDKICINKLQTMYSILLHARMA